MPRIARMFVKGEELAYHIISRTALDGYVIDDGDKDYFVDLIMGMSKVYFVEVLGFSIMSNHFHLVVRMKNDVGISDEEIRERFDYYYNKEVQKEEKVFTEEQKFFSEINGAIFQSMLRTLSRIFPTITTRSIREKDIFGQIVLKASLLKMAIH